MLRRLFTPLLAVLFALALPALVAAQDGGSPTPTKQGHVHRLARSDCPRFRMGPIGMGQREILYFTPQSAAQEGLGQLTITSPAARAGFTATFESGGLYGEVAVTIRTPSPEGRGTTFQTWRAIIGPNGVKIANQSDVHVRVTLTIPPSCS